VERHAPSGRWSRRSEGSFRYCANRYSDIPSAQCLQMRLGARNDPTTVGNASVACSCPLAGKDRRFGQSAV
jgi:hypothetical protein